MARSSAALTLAQAAIAERDAQITALHDLVAQLKADVAARDERLAKAVEAYKALRAQVPEPRTPVAYPRTKRSYTNAAGETVDVVETAPGRSVHRVRQPAEAQA